MYGGLDGNLDISMSKSLDALGALGNLLMSMVGFGGPPYSSATVCCKKIIKISQSYNKIDNFSHLCNKLIFWVVNFSIIQDQQVMNIPDYF